jgi:hypothetical protein
MPQAIAALLGTGSYNGLSWGPATKYHVNKISGAGDMPGIRAVDTLRAFQHGHFRGVDLSAGRVIDITFALVGDDVNDFFNNLLPAFENATVPQPTLELPLLLFNSTRQTMCRPRKRAPKYDAENQPRTGMIDVQFVSSDPRIYDATPTILTLPVATASGGMTFGTTPNLLAPDSAQFEWSAAQYPAPYMGGWGATGNSSVAQSTAQAAEGTKSLAITSLAAGIMYAELNAPLAAYPVSPSTQYTALVSFRNASIVRNCQVAIRWYDSNKVNLNADSFGAQITATTSGWTQGFVTATSPANAAYADIYVAVITPAGAGEVTYIDKASFAPGASTTWAAPAYSGAVFPVTFGSAGTAGVVNAVNNGNFPTRPVIVIAGPVDNPILQNLTTGQYVQFAISLGVADTLTLDFDLHTVLLNGTASRRNTMTPSSQWWELAPGTTQILYGANTTQVGSIATVTYRNAWM